MLQIMKRLAHGESASLVLLLGMSTVVSIVAMAAQYMTNRKLSMQLQQRDRVSKTG